MSGLVAMKIKAAARRPMPNSLVSSNIYERNRTNAPRGGLRLPFAFSLDGAASVAQGLTAMTNVDDRHGLSWLRRTAWFLLVASAPSYRMVGAPSCELL